MPKTLQGLSGEPTTQRPVSKQLRVMLTLQNFSLKRLLRVDVEEFLSKWFGRRAVHIRASRNCESLLGCDPTVEDIAENTASEGVFVWVRCGEKLTQIEVDEPKKAQALFEGGHAVYCRASEETENVMVTALLRDTKLGWSGALAGRGEVEVFCGPRGHKTGWHYDFQENFTIQIRGRKRWKLKKGPFQPLRAHSTHFHDDPSVIEDQLKNQSFLPLVVDEDPQEIILEPGDCLYHPSGTYHEVESLDDSFSMNVSLMAPTTADCICGALRHALLSKKIGRAKLGAVDLSRAFGVALKTLRCIQLDDIRPRDPSLFDQDIDVMTFRVAINVPHCEAWQVNEFATLAWDLPGLGNTALLNVMHGSNDELEPVFRARLRNIPDALVTMLRRKDQREARRRYDAHHPSNSAWRHLAAVLFYLGYLRPVKKRRRLSLTKHLKRRRRR